MKQYLMYFLGFSLTLSSLNCSSQAPSSKPSNSSAIAQMLDANNDGTIDPYEALDVLLLLEKENDAPIQTEAFQQLAQEYVDAGNEEINELFNEFDKNKDGKIKMKEVPKPMKEMVAMMDSNGDNIVEKSEATNFNMEAQMLLSDEALNEWCNELFEGDSKIAIKDLKGDMKQLAEADANDDGNITREEVYQMLKADNTPASFTIKGDIAYMNGVICSTTPARVLELLVKHPNVHTIEMEQVPGSIDDISNLRAALYVHQSGLKTQLNAKSKIASGGTDFFLAGSSRSVAKGAKIGVHSWGGGSEKATDLPKDDEAHQKYLDYYKIVGIPADFYWYTLEAAPAESIHWMTEEAIKTYQIEKAM